MMKTTLELPNNYRESGQVRQESGTLKRNLFIASVLLIIPLFFLGNYLMPLILLGFGADGTPSPRWLIFLKIGIMFLTVFFHSLFLEKVRSVLMKRVSGAEASISFKAGGAYAVSPAYFTKKDYRTIILGPVIILAVFFFLLTMIIPTDWFWVGYAAQAINLAGSVRDYHRAFQTGRQMNEVLIADEGFRLVFYEPSAEPVLKAHSRKSSGNAKRKKTHTVRRK